MTASWDDITSQIPSEARITNWSVEAEEGKVRISGEADTKGLRKRAKRARKGVVSIVLCRCVAVASLHPPFRHLSDLSPIALATARFPLIL